MSPADLEAHFSLIDTTGAAGIRFDLFWRSIEVSEGVYRWDTYDRAVLAATKHKKPVLAILGSAPAWAAQSGCSGEKLGCEPQDIATFARFAKDAVAHYAALGVHHYELWNEPNTWKPEPNAAAYARLVREVCPLIKQVDPQARVVTGGLALGDGKSIPMATFTKQFYESKPGDCFDAVSVHMYGTFARAQLLEVRQLMIEHGDADKRIWATEIGVETTGVCGAQGNPSEARQAEVLGSAVATWRTYDWTGPLFWFITKDVPDYNNRFGLACANDKPKPALAEFQRLAKGR